MSEPTYTFFLELTDEQAEALEKAYPEYADDFGEIEFGCNVVTARDDDGVYLEPDGCYYRVADNHSWVELDTPQSRITLNDKQNRRFIDNMEKEFKGRNSRY